MKRKEDTHLRGWDQAEVGTLSAKAADRRLGRQKGRVGGVGKGGRRVGGGEGEGRGHARGGSVSVLRFRAVFAVVELECLCGVGGRRDWVVVGQG